MRRVNTLCLSLVLTALAHGQLQLPNTLSDHAVLQRDKPTNIFGWALPGEHITVEIHHQILKATADSLGQWNATMMPEPAGGPYSLTVTGDAPNETPIKRNDILIGDVWIASGQSNMAMPLRGFNARMPIKNSAAEIAAAKHPSIRLLHQATRPSAVPLLDTDSVWTECTPQTAATFSAAGYLFAVKIAEMEKVPIGIIETAVGGTPVSSWTSLSAIAAHNFTYTALNAANIAQDEALYNATEQANDRLDAAAKTAGKPSTKHLPLAATRNGAWTNSALFNGMVSPFLHTTIRGVIWYQGETDTTSNRASNYRYSFPAMIQDWRDQWGQGDFPFLFVQISSFHGTDDWAVVRDAQRRALALRDTGMAVILDVGEPTNIHPADKQTVAHRLALAARHLSYGEAISAASPSFHTMTPEGSEARVWFDHAEGLNTHGQPLGGFELAGDDGKFYPAMGSISIIGSPAQQTVLLHAKEVAVPKTVRYDWSATVTTFLYNAAGLPA
ncbi:MAG: sialate O-acetylesterase, partial [Acidobacteriaceae bacterium]